MSEDIFQLRVEGDPVLREVCKEVDKDYPNLKEVIAKMYRTLDATNTGVGLAAPQVGLPIRMFILGGNHSTKMTFINPELSFKGKLKKGEEGCLSIPGIWGDVERYSNVKVTFYDEDFNKQTLKFRGFDAVVIQHEYDHLNGIEFYDHFNDVERQRIISGLQKLRSGDFPDTGNEYFKHENHK